MDKKTSTQSGVIFPGNESVCSVQSEDGSESVHIIPESAAAKKIMKIHRLFFFITVIAAAAFCSVMLFVMFTFYQHVMFVDQLQPDYSSLEVESDNYWIDRIYIDIETAQNTQGNKELREQRLRRFVLQTVADAMKIPSTFVRAQTVTNIASELAKNDIYVPLDHQLRQLGGTHLIVSMRARVLISQALMHLRANKKSAALIAYRQYRELVREGDLRLNSSVNEESFAGAITILCCLVERDEIKEFFRDYVISTSSLGLDQRARAYRLIAGEQVRAGLTVEALEIAKQITNPLEQMRAWSLILQYSARPQGFAPVEPVTLDLLAPSQLGPATFPASAERIANDIFRYLADTKDVNTQATLLRRLAGSRVMADKEIYKIFQRALSSTAMFQDFVKQPALELLENPESPEIRQALNMPPLASPPRARGQGTSATSSSSAIFIDDWSYSEERVKVETVEIDSTPLRTRSDQQWIQALISIAQGYQSVKRFQDAERVLNRASAAAVRLVDTNVRTQLLMRIGEMQVAVGALADAQKTFVTLAPTLDQNQRVNLARIQIVARFFEDAFQTITSIESPENRNYVSSFLLQEQIRLHQLDNAGKTLSLMPPTAASIGRSQLKVAQNTASHEDYTALNLSIPGVGDVQERPQDWEQFCMQLIQQGFLHVADKAASNISDTQKRNEVRARIAEELLRVFQSFNEVNDPEGAIRQALQQTIVSVVSRTGNAEIQTTILTELLVFLVSQMRTEEEQQRGKQLWTQAVESCRRITSADTRAPLLARLIFVRNLLESVPASKRTMPLFTRETQPLLFEEINKMVEECRELINSVEDDKIFAVTCSHLARALIQIGRTESAQRLLDYALETVRDFSDTQETIPVLMSMVSPLKAMNSADTIQMVYRLAVDAVIANFLGKPMITDVLETRMRDSEIEWLVRSQMENGFVDDAVVSARRLTQAVLRDRLLRTAVYIRLDLEDFDRAEWEVQQLTFPDMKNATLQDIQTLRRLAERSSPQDETLQ